ncbi:MAG: hypothetical protein ABI156_14240 [Caldimonas sp.]
MNRATPNREAAFHQAGHAIATHLSRFHILVHPVFVDPYGTGEWTAGLSRRKLEAADKTVDAAARTDPEVAISIARILCAGFSSELIAASKDAALRPDPARSSGDLALARHELRLSGLPEDVGPHESSAAALLAAHWADVERVAEALRAAGRLEPDEINDLLRPNASRH